MSLLKEPIRTLRFKFERSFEYAQPNIRLIGFMGTIAFPLFYFMWRFWFPQPYENLWIRLLGSLFYTPLIFHQKCRRWIQGFDYYWVFCMWFATCFFFPYMLFKNQLNQVWTLSTMAGLVLLVFISYDWKMLLLLYISGLFFTTGVLLLEGTQIRLDKIATYSQNLPIYLFLFIFGNAFNQTKERIIVEKHRTALTVGKNMAHELRSPLVSIRCAIEGLEQHFGVLQNAYQFALSNKPSPIKRIHPLQYQQLFTVPHSIKRELAYSNSTIDMLLFNANNNFLDKVNFSNQSVHACVQSVISNYPFKNKAERESVYYVREDFTFQGDDSYLRNVLFNLLKNALYCIEEMQKGAIFITVDRGDPYFNQLIFKDTAKGIPQNQCQTIFEPFFTRDKHGGTGIGLSFCKQVMESFGGKISCESVAGEYTTFQLYFPKIK